MRLTPHVAAAVLVALLALPRLHAQFRDDFDHPINRDPSGAKGWNFFTGDGAATMEFTAREGIAMLRVDATHDRRGIWWALIKRDVSSAIDLARLAQPRSELRVEARVRTSHAPRRLNLSFNTQRTTDFHTHLMEFDLGEANVWQTISFTTRDFDAHPGDQVNVQLALMDWGLGTYRVDIDYLQVTVVDPATSGPDLGVQAPYRPTPPAATSLRHVVASSHQATVDRLERDANLADWSAIAPDGATSILSVTGTQLVLLRWDFSPFAGRRAAGTGLLELDTHSVQRPAARRKDFGMIRVVEILGGDAAWDERTVTYASLCQGRPDEDVFNPQMIIDVEVNDRPGDATVITLSPAVLQRLIDGRTKGIALLPLGSINASFVPGTARLRFNSGEK